ncbi:MAG TPA: hypothetical protein ENI19_01125 [Candidatus Nealsonbacteria bacterium]|uniref:Uncharacterized protein n=1 Tax=marine sediment metagenome TaxID=412755 RepID=A0A0F9VS15_9ZZZZ|nr:hypothetical protein [Candidatus Nealsonbacteria bacterium]HEB46295.1 hypothetical protein [Candidatus Nealsonbacteria bacterium]
MAETTENKRQSGQVKDGKWLVLTESTRKPDKCYTHTCGTEILGEKIAHPVWDGPTPLSGHGQCEYEMVPYCPKCENKPNPQGVPITPKGSHRNL